MAIKEFELSSESCLTHGGWSADDAKAAGLSMEEAFNVAVVMDTVSAESMDAVDGAKVAVAPPTVYRRYQARGATRKSRSKANIYGITMHTPEGFESGTLSVLGGLRAGFDAYLPLNGRFYPCNDISNFYTWHSGHNWGNPMTIGIEQGDFAANSGSFGDAHYHRLARLCAYYCEVFDLRVARITAPGYGFISHASLTPGQRTDPGAGFRWEQLLDLTRDYMRGSSTDPDPKPDPVEGDTLYRVKLGKALAKGEQLGAYAEKSNADAHKATLAKYNIPVDVIPGKA